MGDKLEIFYNQFILKDGYKLALEGLGVTIALSIVALIIGLIVGAFVAIVMTDKDTSIPHKILVCILKCYVGFFRGTPIIVQLLFIYFVILPLFGLSGGNALLVAMCIFGLNSGAYVSEIIRSGILSVDIGQNEAARALGLRARDAMQFVVFPQALKNSLPPLCNEFIALLKETSVANYITVHDLTYAFRSIGSASYEFMIPYLFLALSYLILVVVATYFVRIFERKLRASDKH